MATYILTIYRHNNAPSYHGNQQTTVSMNLLLPTFSNSILAMDARTCGHTGPQKWQAAIERPFGRPLVSLGLNSLNQEKIYLKTSATPPV